MWFTADGLPIGLQIVGPRHGDALVLRAARAYEAAIPSQPSHRQEMPRDRDDRAGQQRGGHDPFGGETVGEVPLCGPDEVDAACAAAAAALARTTSPSTSGRGCSRWPPS